MENIDIGQIIEMDRVRILHLNPCDQTPFHFQLEQVLLVGSRKSTLVGHPIIRGARVRICYALYHDSLFFLAMLRC